MDQNQTVDKVAEESAAFQKIWVETISRMAQAAFTISPDSPPPEMVRQVRAGVFQAVAAAWDEFMRSPQFLENMSQWAENAIVFRKLSNEFMTRVRTELQAPSCDDIDSVMLTVRHMEKRLLDRVDEVSAEVASLRAQAGRRRRQLEKRGAIPGRRSRLAAPGAAGNEKTIKA